MATPSFDELADLTRRLAAGIDEEWLWDDFDYMVQPGDREIFLWLDETSEKP